MTTYRDSLNLPKTDFPMKASLSTREPLTLTTWEKKHVYTQMRQLRHGKPRYVLHDGPPYANGHLHIGHAVNKILKDIILKSKHLSGWDAPFIPGWDCHGLPIELNVEKKLKEKNYTPKEFRQACRQYASEQIDIQRKEFKRLGVLADWEHPYTTMDFTVEAEIIRAFGKCIAAGYIESGLKPVHWCVACGSALAELEVLYQDKRSTAIDVKFIVIPKSMSQPFPGQGPLSLPIWTTTPWTLPANEAVAIGSNIAYHLIQVQGERFLLADSLHQACLERYSYTDYQILDTYLGKTLQGLQLQHPLESRHVPLILSNHVSTEIGTGAVHIAPSHGPEDYALGLQYQLPLHSLINTQGRYNSDIYPTLHNQSVLKADPCIIDLLSKTKTLLSSNTFTHSYPHCWRHKLPLIFLATPQWFLRLQSPKFLSTINQCIDQVNWIPEWGADRMRHMLGIASENPRPDWCLSRQRYWGVPLPLFIHHETGQYHPHTLDWIETIAQAVERKGVEAWHELNISELLGQDDPNYIKSSDTLDVWFDSGISHYAILRNHPQLQWPADLYLEGADQFRGWFQSSLITSVLLKEQAPYRNVLIHGFTVDKQGQKMSKSIGNTLSLETAIQKWGADIIRLWIASTDTRSEIFISDEHFQRTSEAYRRIRNTVRFLLANLHDFIPEQDSVPTHQLLSLDRWLLSRTYTLQTKIQEAYEQYNFPIIYQTLHNFCIEELGSFYLSILKDRQYTMPIDSIGRRSGQTAIYYVTHAMLRWLAPILSFTAEEAWQYVPGIRDESIFLTEWYSLPSDEKTDPLAVFYQEAGGCENCWEKILQIREIVNHAIESARNNKKIGSALESNLIVYCQPESFIGRLLLKLQPELHFIFLTSSVKMSFDSSKPLHALGIAVELIPVDETQAKCERCWHRRHDVGKDSQHPTLCNRCVNNLPGSSGEIRCYA
jgi:isoleucyl-tRNA synthetase